MGYGLMGALYYLGVFLYYVGPFLLLIGGAFLLTVGIIKRVKNRYNYKSRGMAFIITGAILLLPGGIICGDRGVKAIIQAVDNYNSVYYQFHDGSVKGLERLLKKGACVEGVGLPEERPARDGEMTLLGEVIKFNRIIPDGMKKAALLIEYGADVNRVMCCNCRDGHPRGEHNRLCSATPVLIAADSRNYELLKLLIDNGGDVNATDYNGLTALDIVEENIEDTERFSSRWIKEFKRMRELLIENGAENGVKGAKE